MAPETRRLAGAWTEMRRAGDPEQQGRKKAEDAKAGLAPTRSKFAVRRLTAKGRRKQVRCPVDAGDDPDWDDKCDELKPKPSPG